MGHLDPSELAHLYNGADAFASMSVHHDEDFGMSPVEALCCGTRQFLPSGGAMLPFRKEEAAPWFRSVSVDQAW